MGATTSGTIRQSIEALNEEVCSLRDCVAELKANQKTVVTVDRKTASVVWAAGEIAENGVNEYQFNSVTTRLSAGTYNVTFPVNHPQGNDYVIALTVQSDEPNRDQRKIAFFNKTVTGFSYRVTVDDNGAAADPLVDEKVDWAVFNEEEIVCNVYENGVPVGNE